MSLDMTELYFLTLDDVLRIHDYQTSQYGGDASVLDLTKLESAIAQPRQMFAGEYLHADIASMAAAYLYHIVQNHSFADGNKRTGTHASIAFLSLNGFDREFPLDETEQLVLGVAQGKIAKEQVTDFFRKLLGD